MKGAKISTWSPELDVAGCRDFLAAYLLGAGVARRHQSHCRRCQVKRLTGLRRENLGYAEIQQPKRILLSCSGARRIAAVSDTDSG
jgi:hypothetical protein